MFSHLFYKTDPDSDIAAGSNGQGEGSKISQTYDLLYALLYANMTSRPGVDCTILILLSSETRKGGGHAVEIRVSVTMAVWLLSRSYVDRTVGTVESNLDLDVFPGSPPAE